MPSQPGNMSATPLSSRPRAPRPPRINIHNAMNGSLGSMPPTAQVPPFSAQTNPNMIGPQGQPYWPPYSNPFAAGNFMSKGFDGFVDFTKSGMSSGEKFTFGLYNKFSKWSRKWFTHLFLSLVVLLYTIGGALVFITVEEPHAKKEHQDIYNSQITFLNAMKKLSENFELRKFQSDEFVGNLIYLLRDHSAGVQSLLLSNKTEEELALFENPWTLSNSMFYCGTIYTTIGYGHITPKTILGRSLSVVYAIIGIPMFLILLADFGKLFTRAIKFVWAYVRRMYYTGTCRQVRKQQQFMDVMSGFNTMYDYAVRRPSQYIHGYPTDEEAAQSDSTGIRASTPQTSLSHIPSHPQTPISPYPETFEVDDEFNLPISLASCILIAYIITGSYVYKLIEGWSYIDSFYFVFVSMSTIGFGDFVPKDPLFMMISIIYLIFGLALTSMFINVIQIKLSDTFKDASAKIGATMGLSMGEGSESHAQTPSDLVSVHLPKLDTIGEDLNEGATSPNPRSPRLPQKMNLETVPPPLQPRRATTPIIPEPKPRKKRGFFKK